MTLEQPMAHNANQPFIQILHLFIKVYDIYKLFETCKAARHFRRNIHLSFEMTKQFMENKIFRKEVLQFLVKKLLKLQLTLCEPKQTLLNHIFIHDTKQFGNLCNEHKELLVVCNRQYIFYIDTIISRYIYSDGKQYQKTLNYIKYIKKIYPNCLFYLNLSGIKQMTHLDLLSILSIDGVNLSRAEITNELLENITLPSYTDITHCKKLTKINPKSFASVKTLKVSLNNIQLYDIPFHVKELHILHENSIKMNLYENQFMYLTNLYISDMEVDTWTWIIPNLRKLCLEYCTFTSYENIANFLLLEELTIKACNFDDTQIKHILYLPKLNTLSLPSSIYLTNFSFILQMNLHTLDVFDCKITNNSLQYFIGITDLNLSWTDITDLSMLNTMVKLMKLNISRCNLENISFLYKQQFSELNIAHSSVKESDLVGVAVKKIINNKYL
jgi:uncharacterized protein YjbI with pentapeptide repeats